MYEVGKYYTFDFNGNYVGKDGNMYISLNDPMNPQVVISVRPFDFQQEWDNNIPSKVECFCYRQDVYGRFNFDQSREAILNALYAPYLNHYNVFIIERRVETPNNSVCCVIRDTFGITQLYFPNDKTFWEHNQVGDELTLYVKGIHPSDDGKNNAYLELESREEINSQDAYSKTLNEKSYIRNENVISLGVEDNHTEFKSSIAFPAGGTTEDMPTQLAVFMKSIAGFMNKEGGTLYVGVNDAGEPFRDVSKEFQYLNDDDEDDYTYNANQDHYKLKLYNVIRRDLGDYASSLVNISFHQTNGVTYAAIDVKESEWVVWYKGTKLFVRCGNCTIRMRGDSITNFILSRVSDPNKFKDIVNTPVPVNDIDTTEISQPISRTVAIRKTPPQHNDYTWRYISFYKNGQWSFRKTSSKHSDELLTEVSIPNTPKNQVLMIAYESGKINAVALKDLLYGTGRNKNTLISCDTMRNNGVSSGTDRLVNVFCAKKGGLVLMESVVNDECFVKAHQMDVITIHQSLSAQGNKMQPEGKLVRIAPVEVDSGEMNAIQAMGILVKDYERYSKNGVKKSNLQGKYQELIDRILLRFNGE